MSGDFGEAADRAQAAVGAADSGGGDAMGAGERATGRPTLILTGRAGAGRTTAINTLEDLGFETVDTPPVAIMPEIALRAAREGVGRGVAIGLDARTAGFSTDAVAKMLTELKGAPELRVEMVFLDGSDEALRRRYTETRRRHPLAGDGGLEDGLARDRALMLPIRQLADRVLDTTAMSKTDLVQAVRARYGEGDDAASTMRLSVVSFSFRDGLPADADVVFDCRFLRNPHYDPILRPSDGRDPAVAAYVAEDPRYDAFLSHLSIYPRLLVPAYAAEGKSYLTIAFGCTGGQHRSVAVAETFAESLRVAGWTPRVRHRVLAARERETVEARLRAGGPGAPQPSAEPGWARRPGFTAPRDPAERA